MARALSRTWRFGRRFQNNDFDQLRETAPVKSRLVLIGVLAIMLVSCTRIPTAEEANDAVLMLRQYQGWAWAAGIVLIWADLILPVPQTAVIAALGAIYGTLLGGLIGSFALLTAGLLGYGLMFTSARPLMQRLIGPKPLQRMERLFDRSGVWAIILTRSLPYSLAEAAVILAGLAGMPLRKFIAALALGSAPVAFVFASVGAGLGDQPILALGLSYVLPILLVPIILHLLRRPAR